MVKENCAVLENKKIAPGHWILKLRSRAAAKTARPGQFVQVLCADDSFDPLLPRPFSFLNAQKDAFSILYQVVGKGTELLSKKKKGDTVRVLGPLGNGFSLKAHKKIVLVGGGVGIPPLYHLAETLVKNKVLRAGEIHVLLGARHKTLLLCENDFKKMGVQLSVATDDGSKGHRGFVTELLSGNLQSGLPSQIYTCGPTPMLKAVSALSEKFKVPCEVSVEVPMACGFGACLGCAIKVNSRPTCATEGSAKLATRIHPEKPRPSGDEGSSYRYAIACTEGPVFNASEIVWD